MSTPHPGFAGPAALVPGELRGYRRFRLAEDGLYPTVHAASGPWSGLLERAACAAGTDHPAPAWECGCGLYGWYHPRDAGQVSGFGDVSAVIAGCGRTILGDHGFRAASARIEAVRLPVRVSARPRTAARARQMLAARYPQAVVYRSRRQMLRDHPPQDLQALGINTRPSPKRRYRRTAWGVWAVGVAACCSLALLPREAILAAGPPIRLSVLGGFVLWQALLVWLVARWSAPPPTSSRG
ncbi:MAG: hypothetical protein M3P70_07660 [Actinomycetota bacterium]|nr:hypothetical protein [Actinomycetota bacterium]